MRYIVAILILTCVLAGSVLAQGTPTRIGYFSMFEIYNLNFAVENDAGQTVWVNPESSDYGSLGSWTIDNDPDNRFILNAGTPGEYKTYAVVGMEHEGNWAGYGMGTQTRAIKGVRLDLKCDYNPEELTYQLWTSGMGLDPAPVATFQSALGIRHHEIMFNGGNTIEWRVIAVVPPPPVPEPSSLAALTSTLGGFALTARRRTRKS